MKKVLLLLCIAATLVFSAVCASAETYADYTPENDKYTVEYDVGTANAAGMYGMVAILGADEDAIINTNDLSNIYYIDQTSAGSNGKILFANFAPKGAAPSSEDFVECTVYIGGPGFGTAQKIGYLKKGETIAFLLGDIDGNGSVDIDDAILLLQYSIFPDFYPIEYPGNVDFDKNESIDIDDAVLLLQYSIFPDFYPIG